MEGVQVLSEYMYKTSTYISIALGIVCFIAFVIGIAVLIANKGKVVVVVCCILCIVSLGIAIPITEIYPAGMQYKVLVDDDVTFSEFTSTYDILSREGDIYTVTERK